MGIGLSAASLALTIAGAATSAYGAYETGQAQKASAHYNAGVNRINAALARQNAQIAMESGNAQVGIQGQKTRATIANTRASQAASGVSVDSGSFKDVIASERTLGELDALNVRTNAVREAYGLHTKAVGEEAQATLSEYEGKNAATAGMINAGSTLLSGAGDALGNWQKFQTAGGSGKGFKG